MAWKTIFGYGIATLLQGLVAFAGVPMIIRILGARNFALWAILEPLALLVAQFSLLGTHFAYIRLLASGKKTAFDVYCSHRRFGVHVCAILCLIGACVSVVVLGFDSLWTIASLTAVLAFLEATILLSQSVARGESDALGYAATVWIKFGVLGVGLGLASWSGLRTSLIAFVSGLILIDVAVITLVFLRYRRLHGHVIAPRSAPTREDHSAARRYGMPIVVAVGLGVIAANTDRYLVHMLMAPEELPGYLIMAKLAGAMSFAAAPINLWWPSARFRHSTDVDGGAAFFSSATSVLLLYYLTAAIAAWALAPRFVDLYAQGISGYDSATMATLLCAGVATAMTTPVNVGTLDEGKTHWIVGSVGVAAATGIFLALLLIPIFGYLGAALGSLGAQCAGLTTIYWVSQRIQPFSVEYRKLFVLFAGFGVTATLIVLRLSLWVDIGAVFAFVILGGAICADDLKRLARS